MANISDKEFSKLAETIRQLSIEDQQKAVERIEAKYPQDLVKKLRNELKNQFSQLDEQSNKLQNVEVIFSASKTDSVTDQGVKTLVQAAQDAITNELLQKLPDVPTHQIKEREPKLSASQSIPGKSMSKGTVASRESNLSSTPQAAAAEAKIKVQQYRQHKTPENRQIALDAIKTARQMLHQARSEKPGVQQSSAGSEKSRSGGGIQDDLRKVAHNARMKARVAVLEAKAESQHYKQNKNPATRKSALHSIRHARQLLRHAHQLERQAERLDKSLQQTERFKHLMDKFHTDNVSQGRKTKSDAPEKRGPK